jgi:hypothetical protein
MYVAAGSATLTNCALANDTAVGGTGGDATLDGGDGGLGQGGAIYVAAGPVTLNNCTFSNDTAAGGTGGNSSLDFGGHGGHGLGGGICVAGGPVTLTNCTFANDTAAGGNGGNGSDGGAGYSGRGGAVFLARGVAVTLNDSTLSNNTAVGGTGGTGPNGPAMDGVGYGGGVGGFGAALTLNNTIIAGNSAATSDPNLFSLQSYSGGNDLLSGDPLLAPLGDYGGPTQTMPPLPGSPALDAGRNALLPAGLTTDQRGFARISGAAVDIGADEVQEPSLSPATLPDGTYGTAYSHALSATESGSPVACTFAVTAGALPAGLSLDGTAGTLSGTPSAAGSFIFTVTATDGAGFTGSQSYTLTIDKAALTITADSTGKTYGQAVTFAGTEFTVSGLVNGDTVSSVTLSSAGAAASAGVAGSPYAIVASAAVGSGLGNYTISYVNGALTVSPATPTLTWANPADIVYGTALGGTQLDATASAVVNGSTVSVPGTFTYTLADGTTPALGAVLAPGQSQTLLVSFTPTDTTDFTGVSGSTTLNVEQATLTVTAGDATRGYGAANPGFTATITGFIHGQTLASSGVTGSPSLSTSATAASPPGSYAISAGLGSLASADYAFAFVNGTLTVTAAPLSAAGVNFLAAAGGPYGGPVATFANPDPGATAASYTATITWGDGTSSVGVIGANGDGTFSVLGTHTYTDPGSYAVAVQIGHNLGFTTTATAGSTATVVSLGQPVQRGMVAGPAFWGGQGGQALILAFGGGPASTSLAGWLAATLPNLFGAAAGACNLTGMSNAEVAVFYQWLRHQRGKKLEAEVLALALSIYATTPTLGGPTGAMFGFNVSGLGLGPLSVGVGRSGSAFGVANHSELSV